MDNTRPMAGGPTQRRSAVDMVNDCFRHQHPEAYGRGEVPEPPVPSTLRWGTDPVLTPRGPELAETAMGHPEAHVLPS